ncbi:choline/carnitine/betaine transport [Desulfosporosinus orientis DSM 765]|uniref:Choline/carnitine/betaine transport n=1 Tax=Desulfosporosinus orientis (strain ATCC 19365 / DSM 765 / NCIMB 8382 / VKM B-1628 / Singapore I) TaxID=768706 RepID=G7WAP8_DESOD|nr:BCCT family transporter [Desulfosporosinus orientis]AET66816.1 choline/carnitine/betaine transport [Desulfosporosinus orientis DSM 765]
MAKPQLDHKVFWPAFIVIFGLSLALLLNREAGAKIVDAALAWSTYKLDWLFQMGTFLVFVFLIWIAFGRYGNVKLGGPDDKPEFSTLSWIAMLFCAGIGSSLIYWAVAEPLYYLQGPPFGIAKGSSEAYQWALTYGMFHWGFSAWALYAIPSLPIAYAYYVRKDPQLRASTACRPILGNMVDGWMGKVIDILVMFGIVGGFGTSLGLGVPLLAKAASTLLGIPQSMGLNFAILAIWTIIFGFSVYTGLYKGIKRLSDINVYLALALLVVILAVGPTFFILSVFTDSVGVLFNNFFRMSFYTDPIVKSGFPQAWTVFYWAWWIALAPYMGLFVARISKGRTLKQLIIAEVLWGTLGDWAFFGVFGGYTLHLEFDKILPAGQILSEDGGPAAIIAVINSLPMSQVILVLFLLLEFVFLATCLDSSAYVCASMATKQLNEDEQPARWNRIVWALALAAIGIAVLSLGGMNAIQTSSVVAAVPLVFVLLILTLSFMKMLKEDHGIQCSPKEITIQPSKNTNISAK